jgi:hypothetical protein
MFKLKVAFAVVIANLVGCAGQNANSSPPAAPADNVEFKFNATDENETGGASNPSAESETNSESAKPEPKTQKAEHSESSETTGPPEKYCSGLLKTKCEITVGCAWHTDKNCVAQ